MGSKTERENNSNTNKVRKSEDTRRLCRTYDYKNVKDGAKDPDPKYLIITISKIVVPAAIWYNNLFFLCIYRDRINRFIRNITNQS